MLGVVRCGTGPSSRVRARAPLVPHLLCGAYKRGLHSFQGGQDMTDAFVHLPEEENAGGGAGRNNRSRASPGDVALGHDLR